MRKQKNMNTNINIDEIISKAKNYVTSEEGKNAIKNALRDAQETTSRLDKARRVDPKSLHDPITL